MTTRKTIVWIIVSVVALCIIALVAVAGAGLYFVTRHIQTERRTNADAMQAFESVRREFKDVRPLYEIDDMDQPRVRRSLGDLPTSPRKPDALTILAWNPEHERLVRVSLPFWVLRLGKHDIDISHAEGFNLRQLQLDVPQLERVGPALLFDFRNPEGVRVLVWTQ